ncbi:M61 family metallopeptidase [Caldiplasma sukawensis]
MKLSYFIEMRDCNSGFYEIAMNIENIEEDSVIVTMPAWTPGSYLIRDFARNVRMLRARSLENEPIDIVRKDKSSWRILNGQAKSFIITYEVYAGELSVRTSHLDGRHGFVLGSSVFLYLEGYKDQSVELTVKPPQGWHISTGLEKIGENRFRATNYDVLVDCPMEIGTHKSFMFTVDGKEHEVAIFGEGIYDENIIIRDMKKIVEAARNIFGGFPYKRYVFLITIIDQEGGGGLEHMNSCAININRFYLTEEENYKKFLLIVAHEFFHLWNVKRIRPSELGPFNYKEETYTTLLWFSEGVTDYYAKLICLRAGLIDEKQYYELIADDIMQYSIMPGTKYESAADSSFDAWIKLYKPSPNNINSYVSYYLKGQILGLLINIRIGEFTKGTKCLDDVMRGLMDKFNRDGKGIGEKELLQILNDVSGMDFSPFFQRFVRGTEKIDFQKELKRIGLELKEIYRKDGKEEKNGTMGLFLRGEKVESVIEGYPAQKAGISPGDEIVAVNNYRFTSHFRKPFIKSYSQLEVDRFPEFKPGDEVNVKYFRNSILYDTTVILAEQFPEKIDIYPSAERDESKDKIRGKILRGQ